MHLGRAMVGLSLFLEVLERRGELRGLRDGQLRRADGGPAP
jgi:hypothetical protein